METRVRIRAITISVQLMLSQEKWREILRNFSDNVLQGCKPLFRSLGCNDHTPDISTYFQNLFDCNVSLAESLLKSGPIRFDCIIYESRKKEKFPLITEAAALKTLARLLYGVRCMLAHTNHSKTFGKTGALYDFPKKERFKELMGDSNPEAVDQFYNLYSRAEAVKVKQAKGVRDGSIHPQIFHSDIVNLQRFIIVVAHRFHNTVAELVKNRYKLEEDVRAPLPLRQK